MVQRQKSYSTETNGTLYLVPTPIGNLEDMTFRAVRILNEVSLIASEDTRHTQKLLNHFDIHVPQVSFHEHNIKERIPQLIEKLKQGDTIAQVSDAGMPCISDPGYELVQACIEHDIPVVSLPGANAALTALIASGLSPKTFYFHGFLPRKKQEQVTVLTQLKEKTETIMFYESPFRVKKTLEVMAEVFDTNRQVVVCRELTKKHEEYVRGSLEQAIKWAQETEIKGEICILVQGILQVEQENHMQQHANAMPEQLPIPEQVAWVERFENMTQKDAIKIVAKRLGKTKQEVYKLVHGG